MPSMQLPGDSPQGHWGASPPPRTMAADPWKGRPVLLTPFKAETEALVTWMSVRQKELSFEFPAIQITH